MMCKYSESNYIHKDLSQHPNNFTLNYPVDYKGC